MVSSVEGRPGCLPGRAFLFHHPRIIVSSRTEIPTALTSVPSPQTPTTTDTSRCKMAPHGAETRLSLLVASKDYEKMKARGQKDTSFPYRVEQSIRGGLISVDDDFAKMCLTDERRSVLARQVTKGLGRQMKKQRQKERNQASSARLAIQPQPPLTGVQAMVQPQHLSEHLAGDQVTVSLPQHSTGDQVTVSLPQHSTGVRVTIQPQHLAGDQVTVYLPQHPTGVQVTIQPQHLTVTVQSQPLTGAQVTVQPQHLTGY
jgi:hypothetical protein